MSEDFDFEKFTERAYKLAEGLIDFAESKGEKIPVLIIAGLLVAASGQKSLSSDPKNDEQLIKFFRETIEQMRSQGVTL